MRRSYVFLIAVLMCFTAIGLIAHVDEKCEDVVVEKKAIYYGTAECSIGWELTSPPNGIIKKYYSASSSRYVTLTKEISWINENDYTWTEKRSCTAELPYVRYETVTERICEPIEHTHKIVAVADVFDDEMDVWDSSCKWGGWGGYTNSKINTLYCGGKRIAAVTEQLGQQEHFCSVSIFDDGYSRKYPGSKTCYITILKDIYE